MEEAKPAPSLSFPTDPREFDSDERISYSQLDKKFIAVQDDGTELEFDNELKRWIPTLSEDDMERQRQAYGGSAEDDDLEAAAAAQRKKKRKQDDDGGEPGARPRPPKKQRQPPQPRQNTAVYVTGLPPDATVDEVAEVFSRKCGVIAEEIDSGRPRIKLYADKDGHFKGDALIVFFKPQSVEMAIMLLDDTDFRYSASGLTTGRMRVQAADLSYKKTHYDNEEGERGDSAPGNGAAATTEEHSRPKEKRSDQDKQKVIKKTQKLAAKLADWDDDEPYGAQLETNARKNKTVILRHMFTLKELDEDPAAMLDITEDIREECEKLGPVTNVVLFDMEEDGVAMVKFKTFEAAEACVNMMDGRAFDGRTVRATISEGKEKFRKSKKKQDDEDEDED